MNIFGAWSSEKVCRTRMISKDFFECKVKSYKPKFCEYSLCLGDSFICNHPERLALSNQK